VGRRFLLFLLSEIAGPAEDVGDDKALVREKVADAETVRGGLGEGVFCHDCLLIIIEENGHELIQKF